MTVTLNRDEMPPGERRTLDRLTRNAAIRTDFRSLRAEGVPKDEALERVGATAGLTGDGVSAIIWPRRRRKV
ncbi:MAG TPA: hypothetical protein VF576_13010 [Rubricoccaceae bacterium]